MGKVTELLFESGRSLSGQSCW